MSFRPQLSPRLILITVSPFGATNDSRTDPAFTFVDRHLEAGLRESNSQGMEDGGGKGE